MMALDNLMRNESQFGDLEDGFEGAMSASDLNGDMHGDYDDDDEDGSSGRGSSFPDGSALFDSDILSLDQADKALKYARRTQDVDERVGLFVCRSAIDRAADGPIPFPRLSSTTS